MNRQPPKWADRFLEWYCNPRILEEIQGDIYELYRRRIKQEKSTDGENKIRVGCFSLLQVV